MNMNHVTPTHEESFRKKWENYIPQELHQTFNLMLDVVINEARDGMKSPDVQPQPAHNPIAEAYERGEKIRKKNWGKGLWIKKHSNNESMQENGRVVFSSYFNFNEYPEKWGIYTEPTEQPAKPFDRERFERIYLAVVAGGQHIDDLMTTENTIKLLDAYYAEKEKGGNNE